MALGNGYHNAVADDRSGGSSGRQYLAPRGPQPLVDDTGIHPIAELDRPVGICIHAMAESCLADVMCQGRLAGKPTPV